MPFFQTANWSAESLPPAHGLEPGEEPRYEPVLAGPHLAVKFRKSLTF